MQPRAQPAAGVGAKPGLLTNRLHAPSNMVPQRAPGPQRRSKVAAFSRTAAPSKPAEPSSPLSSMDWLPLPWSRSSGPEAEPRQETTSRLGSLLTWSSSSSPQQQQPPPQQPATSRTGTQLMVPLWGEGNSRPSSSGSEEREATSSLPYWRLPGTTQKAAPLRQPGPIVSCAGGGIFFFWECGVMKYLMENFDVSKCQLVGVSAGGLAVTLAECGVSPDRALAEAYRLALENDVFERPAGLAGIWGGLVREWLEKLLPEDAAERCSGRLRLVVTQLPSLKLRYVETFTSKDDLIDALMATVHIPFLMDGKLSCTFRGQQCMDGSLYDFIFGTNSELITCKGEAFVVDYFNDEELQYSRLDFVKLNDFNYVKELERSGYSYAERIDARGELDPFLGSVRKGVVRRVIEYPVRSLSGTLARVFA